MVGQGLLPRGCHPFADLQPESEVQAWLNEVEHVISRCVKAMPLHTNCVAQNCGSVLC